MPTQDVIDTLLASYGWTGKPADHIVNMGGYRLANIANKVQLWHTLNKNVWRYARANNWVWSADAGNNGNKQHLGSLGPGKPDAVPGEGTLGFPLLAGANPALSCNCGVFNTIARQLAWHILGFKDTDISGAFTTSTFVTLPGSRPFDQAWTGNVRTVAADFPLISALKFTNHSFSKGPDGNFTDATCKVASFANKTDIMWFDCKLPKDTIIVKDLSGWLMVDHVYDNHGPFPPGGPPYYLIAASELRKQKALFPVGGAGLTQTLINAVPDLCATNNNWPNWWLLSPNDLSNSFKQWARYFLDIPGYAKG
jgi:hypothetical protein